MSPAEAPREPSPSCGSGERIPSRPDAAPGAATRGKASIAMASNQPVGLARLVVRTARDRLRERRTWLRVGRAVEGSIAWGAELLVHPDSGVALGVNSSIGHGTVIAIKPGPAGPGALRIGRQTYVGEYNNLRSEGAELVIGDHCLISQFVSLIATGHAYALRGTLIGEQGTGDKAGVTIGDDVWVGAGAVILPGVAVGRGAVVAAGSIVTRDVSEYAIVAGSPARPVGARQ